MDNTWIKLYRKTLNNDSLFRSAHTFTVWCWLLLNADYKTGELTIGRFSLSAWLKIKPSTLYQTLKRLENMTMIQLKSNNKMTRVKILNWSKYQSNPNINVEEQKEENNNKNKKMQQQNNTIQEYKNNNKEYININGKAQKLKYTSEEFIKDPVKHGFTTPMGESSKSYKENKNGIHTEWQEKAFRYAGQLGIDLEVIDEKGRSVKPRWLKVFKDAHNGIRFINLERATSYLIDYKKPLPSNEKIKLFFWVYANNKKMKGDYVTTY